MGDSLEEMLRVTIGRLEHLLEGETDCTQNALDNDAENLIYAAIDILLEDEGKIDILLEDEGKIDKNIKIRDWIKLHGWAKQLYVQTIRSLPEQGEKGHFKKARSIMKAILICKREKEQLMEILEE